jgi:precorrin-3B methylase
MFKASSSTFKEHKESKTSRLIAIYNSRSKTSTSQLKEIFESSAKKKQNEEQQQKVKQKEENAKEEELKEEEGKEEGKE